MSNAKVATIRDARLLKKFGPFDASVDARLATHEDQMVRGGFAGREMTHIGWLSILANDPVKGVRLSVAGNDSCPLSILALLAEDEESCVRQSVLKNTSLTEANINDLFAADSVDRKVLAARNEQSPEVLETFAQAPEAEVRVAVAINPRTPPEALIRLSQDSDVAVRLVLADHGFALTLPDAVLENLALDPELEVRLALAENDFRSEKVAEILAEDSYPQVRLALSKNIFFRSE